VLATDLGQLGTTYPIAEDNLITVIQDSIQSQASSGELAQKQQHWRQKMISSANRPSGNTLAQAVEYRSFSIDPTYTLPEDLHDHLGRVVYPKGTRFNPLDIKPLTETLCFIDATKPLQVQWIKRHCNEGAQFKRIVVNGAVAKTRKALKTRVYFDQHQVLAQFFHLQAVPAVVRQSGGLLHVEEFAP